MSYYEEYPNSIIEEYICKECNLPSTQLYSINIFNESIIVRFKNYELMSMFNIKRTDLDNFIKIKERQEKIRLLTRPR